jgi:hypothetical protein
MSERMRAETHVGRPQHSELAAHPHRIESPLSEGD